MELEELKQKINFSDIKDKVQKVICYSQGLSTCNIDALMNSWLSKKLRFMELMNYQTIYRIPEKVNFSLNKEMREEKINHFIYWVNSNFRGTRSLTDFINANCDEFFENITMQDYISPETGEVLVPRGEKLIKAFKHFIEDKDDLSLIQNKASMLIQENKISGYLCLSVNPLDFLSASENNYNWRSCHALDGEYRAGNLSYMVDDCTVMAYLCGNEDEVLPRFPDTVPWNSKKWRVWLYFSNDGRIMWAGRQYPFISDNALQLVKTTLFSQAGFPTNWSPFFDKYVRSIKFDKEYPYDSRYYADYKYMMIGKELVPINEMVKTGSQARNFNDLLYSSCYIPQYSYRYEDPSGGLPCWPEFASRKSTVTLGGAVKCVQCGEYNIACPESMLCENCTDDSEYYYCEQCGERVYEDDVCWVEDEPLCPHCADRYAITCDDCGNWIYSDNGLVYETNSTDLMLCSWCYNRRMRDARKIGTIPDNIRTTTVQ